MNRRSCLRAAVAAAAAAAGGWPGFAWPEVWRTDGARISADFEPSAAVWLGYDAGHEQFTADLAAALAPFVPLKMLVRDAAAETRARELLQARGIDVRAVPFVHDARAPFFVRDAAVFGLRGDGRPFIVDFQWTHYGWTNWCRRTFAGSRARARDCARTDDIETGGVDQRLAEALGIARFATPLAMEGGGVEVNGRGLVIANAPLWRERNRGLAREAIERHLLALPGMRKVIWIPYGLAQDPLHRGTITGSYVGWGTGGHTDEFVRFAGKRTVLLASDEDGEGQTAHPVARINRMRMQANHEVLSAASDADGKPLRVVKVPLPRVVERPLVLQADGDAREAGAWSAASFPARDKRRDGETVLQVATASYLNHVVANGVVLLPDYVPHGTPAERQERVRAIYASVFPGRQIRFIDALAANWVGGGAHCATLNEPAPRG